MNIPLKKQYADWIAGQISSGRYASEIEAVEDAIAAKIEDEEIERLRARLKESIAQADRGETVVADEAFFERKKQRIRDLYLNPGK
jgi:putative addiction module CopG family antidote